MSDDEDDNGAPKKLVPKEEPKKEDEFSGSHYDVRIKTHWSGSNRCVIFVFTNVSAEKNLQRELVMKQYTQIMFASVNHELRTPINGKFYQHVIVFSYSKQSIASKAIR